MSPDFAARLLRWFDQHGRHDLPWQSPRTPYRVWLSEIMLQQTQVAAVIPYFKRFVERFPDIASLAAAPPDDVLQHWAGLGYYARARNLQRAAQIMVADHSGAMPQALDALMALPGIGRSTAAAILTQAYGQRHAILDGNVKRVLSRHGAITGWPGEPAVTRQLWALSERLLPKPPLDVRIADYTQAIMDLGATLCTSRRPACTRCPVSPGCAALAQDRVAEFPSAKPRRERPLKAAQLLLVENAAGALLFERRPPVGIWGGLWCLPMIEDCTDAEQHLLDSYGLATRVAGQLEPFRHSFTHYDLDLLPVRLKLRKNGALVNAVREHDGQRWINMHSETPPGLPAPVARLLRQTLQD